MKAIRTVYSSNHIPVPFSNVEIIVDIPEAKETAFILVINKNDKKKTKVSSFSSTDSTSKISLVSRAPPI